MSNKNAIEFCRKHIADLDSYGLPTNLETDSDAATTMDRLHLELAFIKSMLIIRTIAKMEP